jgi:co-chaperonin GroES (HSP10)/ElaB/YqjD/DUF883 family membrane-anchored ribosome-binding protein
VTFDIDANGILNVTAKDKDTGKDQKITISGSSSMDEDEVDRLRKEAEKFADSDKEKVEQVQVRNELDSMVYQCEKQLSDLGDKAPKELKESIDGILSNSKKVLENKGASLSELKEAKDSLQKTFEQLGQEAMKHQNAGSTGPVPGGPSEPQDEDAPDSKATDKKANEDDIVDADFEVVDEADKKRLNFRVRFQLLISYALTSQIKPNPKKRKMSKVKITPLGDRVLVKQVDEDEQIKGGIIIPDSAKEKPQEAEVVALGTGKKDDDGNVIAFQVKKGDKVLISKYGGTEVKLDDVEYQLVREDDILGVIG